MKAFVLRRLLLLLPLLLAISFLVFFLMSLAPGDYLTTLAEDPSISRETIEAMRVRFGLDRPPPVQYLLWLKNVVFHLDFGESFSTRTPVFELIASRMGNTLVLALAASLLAWGLSIPLGVLAAVRHNTWVDRSASLFGFIGLSVPEVFLALLLVLLAARTGWFPIGGMRSLDYDQLDLVGKIADRARHLVLPAVVLATVPMASRMRQMRANLLEVLRADYVTTARAKGLPERTVIGKHALRNALNPLITLFGFTVASMLSGSVLVESVMSWPGLGRLTVEALFAQDLYLVMGSLMMAATMLVLGNLVADVLLALSDPRIAAS